MKAETAKKGLWIMSGVLLVQMALIRIFSQSQSSLLIGIFVISLVISIALIIIFDFKFICPSCKSFLSQRNMWWDDYCSHCGKRALPHREREKDLTRYYFDDDPNHEVPEEEPWTLK